MEWLTQIGDGFGSILVAVVILILAFFVWKLVSLSAQASRIRRAEAKQAQADEALQQGLLSAGFTHEETRRAVKESRDTE
jgi:uncharacterized membrane-anchored protein